MYFNKFYFIEYLFFFLNSCIIMYVILIDWMSLMFISFVFLISSMILLYSMEYMNFDFNKSRFLMLMNLFIMFMLLLIISPNMISILLGWDGLGMISFCLVIYYQNSKSYSSGFVTVFLNRIGDLFIILSLIWMLNFGSWNFIFLDYYKNLDYLFYISLMIMFASLTKSAQIPFSSWLPLAMAAPTPVSSLVHSSTLVTAGVYLMIRFNEIFLEFFFFNYLLVLSCLTMFMSGLNAIFEFDLKKIIAFSTLSQMSFMFMILCMGKVEMCFFYLLMHALFKSMMFLSAGVLILNMNNNQDIRKMGGLINYLPFCSLIFIFTLMALCGFPFFCSFYSKDLIFEFFLMSNLNFIFFFFFLISFFLTFFYSIRVIYYLLLMNFCMLNYLMIIKFESNILILSMLFISFIMMFFGSFFMWLMFYKFDLILLEVKFKILSILVLMFGIWFFFELNNFLFSLKFMFSFFNIFFFSLMWNLLFFSINFFLNNFLFFGFFGQKVVEIGWTEYNLNSGIFFFFKSVMIFNQKFFLNSYKVYTLLFFLWFLIIFMFNF
uniref:NADH-ubiquinone oxidoreductase chain 5 n=1 Tax=Kaburagia rhusicola ovogallis TaxID=384838 RepID=A0A1Z1MWG9_9HEMI|nr:NADH dehydrogenase subunit 5 [Kaburagia rhusicola ovogallis]ARW70309.1 NADH dehydrogenase subunit 5 [Kaburagia rhusicola ovogallis]UIE11111.1 NADH dehydrogenase subunit 5 [Kaburagia rhusicola ovogallis]UIE11124.1 NADH dehydrogenase subunit 5 [Kaburagia rhusicola ovogallis]UIE11150.1 NADH dehydrogenase subunit 5 [Kaburagia rhusicola ovogallis]